MSVDNNDYEVTNNYLSALESRISYLEEKMEWLLVRHHEARSRSCVGYPKEDE